MHRLLSHEARSRALYTCCALLLILLNACASTPRELANLPVLVHVESDTVRSVPGLAPRLVSYSDNQSILKLNPAQAWQQVQMRDQHLQTMVEHCKQLDRSVIRIQRATIENANGAVLSTLITDGNLALTELSRYANTTLATTKIVNPAILRLKLDPAKFYGEFKEEIDLILHDTDAQIAPGLYASLESVTTTPHRVDLGQRTMWANYLYIKLSNRSEHSYTLNGHDTGAMEAGARHMLTAPDLHGDVIPPNAAMVIRLPVELLQTRLGPSKQRNFVSLDDYLSGTDGVIGPWIEAMIPLRIQVELQSSDPYAPVVQRGLLMPSLQVQKRYLLERAGCFS